MMPVLLDTGVIVLHELLTPKSCSDACLIQLADELGTGDILTLDRDFERFRWRRTRPFSHLVPLG